MAVFRVVTFLIHAIALAFASLLTAVLTHIVPALLAIIVPLAVLAILISGAGVGGAVLRRRRRSG